MDFHFVGSAETDHRECCGLYVCCTAQWDILIYKGYFEELSKNIMIGP